MDGYWTTATSDEKAYAANLDAIQRHLTKTRALPLLQADLDGVARVYRAFYWYGPSMNYSAGLDLRDLSRGAGATYYDLMTQVGGTGEPLSYLATEARFTFIKDLQSKNLIVPVVGNFGGPKAIRAIGDYVRSRGAVVAAFYVSTVEPYLKRAGTFETFCASVATLPVDAASSVFIRPGNVQNLVLSTPNVPSLPSGQRIGQYQIGVIVPIEGGCK
jgi:hypothetical protein